MAAGAELLGSRRGQDDRFEDVSRPTREQKRQDHQERKDARAAARAELERERKSGVWTESVNYKHQSSPKDSGK